MDFLSPIGAFFTAIERFFIRLWYFLERTFVVYPLETITRLVQHLDPRVHFQSMRILGVTDGSVAKKDNTFFILVLYSKGPAPEFLMNMIEAVNRSPHNLILVSNFPLSTLQKAQLSEKCLVLIERKNIGRDFGGYKDGVNYVRTHFRDVSRIVLVNDSLFFFRKSLDKLISDLNAPHDFIGVTETQEFHYHVQSFLLSFGPAVIQHPLFEKFWDKYRPISTRYWTIHRGEVRLTRQITKAGFRPHILFPAAHLFAHLQRRPVRDAIESVRLLPIPERRKLYKTFLSFVGEKTNDAAISALEAVAYGVRRISPGGRGSDSRLLQINNQAAGMEQWSLGIFPDKIVSAIGRKNQMHYGAFLFMKHLGLPILKRDIFFRRLYTLEEIHQILTDLNEPLRDEVLADLRRTGSGENFRRLRGLMYRHGMI